MKISFVASDTQKARAAKAAMVAIYGQIAPDAADVIVALGGDGFMLETLAMACAHDTPVYGMNLGTVGFLMNGYDTEDLKVRIAVAREQVIHPLAVDARDVSGACHRAYSINEISLLRQGPQAANLAISVDGTERLAAFAGDGVMVATPAGSTAYNHSANGPILPIGANVLALTPLAAFRPRRWRGAVLPERAVIDIAVDDPQKRPVMINAGRTGIDDVVHAQITLDRDRRHRLLFDKGHDLEERILNEQFQ